MLTTSLRWAQAIALTLSFGLCTAVLAQSPKIASISVGPSYAVLGPDHATPINSYGGLSTTSDEHSTIFPPGTLPFQPNYLFLVAARTGLAPDASGLIFLTNLGPPNQDGQWSMDFASLYGLYKPFNLPGDRNGPVFVTAMAHANCPTTGPDPTFDLNYAAPASAFVDPTNSSDYGGGNLILVYEGTNRCIGITGTSNQGNNFYSTIGIATSKDLGYTWPTYRANFTALPGINATLGPNAPYGAWGSNVCWGNFCPGISFLRPPPQYGRYAISGPVTTVEEAIASSSNGLAQNTGDSEPATFVDDVHDGRPTYAYAVHTYNPGPFAGDSGLYPHFPSVQFDLSISRFALNGGISRIQATHWYQGQFTEPGLGSDGGGHESLIFPHLDETLAMYQHCLSPSESRSSASLSYSDTTHEYVLFFVCLSPTEPQPETTYQITWEKECIPSPTLSNDAEPGLS